MENNVKGIKIVQGSLELAKLRDGNTLCVYVIGSTMTSTIPGISLAGQNPLITLFTPALDVEYLYYGKPVSFDIIPTTPEGIPTPALITRVALNLMKTPFLVVNAGSFLEPRIPSISLPSRTVGKRIDIENAFPFGTSRKLFNEAKLVGKNLGSIANVVLIGESIPAGTTTALAILRAILNTDYSVVSSSSKQNPVDLKKKVVENAVKRVKGGEDVFEVNDVLGDPVHISIAGVALGALEEGSYVVLAGGTQMLAVLTLMSRIEPGFDQGRTILATTRWIFVDKGREIMDIIRVVSPQITLAYADIDFSDSKYWGLRAYEEGYVKEGVGAGGTAFLAIVKGIGIEDLKKGIYDEYNRLTTQGAV